jgi:glutathione S-transferase
MSTASRPRPAIYHIPVCPFSQRVEILLELKGRRDAVDFQVVDITKPRESWLLDLTRGTTELPVMQDENGRVLKESLVLLRYFDERYDDRPVARTDPYERDRAAALCETHLGHYRWLDAFLREHNPDGTWLFDGFGLAEVVYTPMFMRFWFLEYYEGFALPATEDYARVARWREACLSHPTAQQVCREEIVKLYYDYAVGAGNGALPEGRARSSFVFEPDWPDRPMPPRDKYDRIATDAELGLLSR